MTRNVLYRHQGAQICPSPEEFFRANAAQTDVMMDFQEFIFVFVQ